ncbi:glycosyltransferase [Candidatus Thioglobus sp.]|nr:glycosyltransferase [Candidatus Thioglobus sp.]
MKENSLNSKLPKKVIHIIIGLNIGGAELMLYRLIKNSLKNGQYNHEVITLTGLGIVGSRLRKLGVLVTCLNMKSSLQTPAVFFRLFRILYRNKKSIIQTWMYHADFLGGLAAFVSGNRKIVWNIRGSSIPQEGFSLTGSLVKVCTVLSFFVPKKIVCCSEVSKTSHIDLGYAKKKIIVITNGYDLHNYNTNTNANTIKHNLGIKDNEIVIGIIGRLDPLKDYQNFMFAARELIKKYSNIKLIMIGRGIEYNNKDFMELIGCNFDLTNFLLLGERRDVNQYLGIMDIYCMSSLSEGFPNTVCEAMAMKIPCVVTDAGDAKNIVSDTGITVPIKDHLALSSALKVMISLGPEKRKLLGDSARNRIKEKYSICNILKEYESIYNEL